MGVSLNGGTPKSSILIGFSIINHPFWGTTILGNSHIVLQRISCVSVGRSMVEELQTLGSPLRSLRPFGQTSAR